MVIATKTFKMHPEKKQCKKNLYQRKLLASTYEGVKCTKHALKKENPSTYILKEKWDLHSFFFYWLPLPRIDIYFVSQEWH